MTIPAWKKALYAELGIKPLDPSTLTRMDPEAYAEHLRNLKPKTITVRVIGNGDQS